MKDREYFYKEDYKTAKKKFLRLCNHCNLTSKEINILIGKEENE